MRILLIEDDKKLSFAITEQLQKEGNITDCCYDGETALHYALNPDLFMTSYYWIGCCRSLMD